MAKKREIQWNDAERQKLVSRILSLRNDQIAEVFNLVGLAENRKDLQWTDKERKELESRILGLRNDQIAALLNLAGLAFHKDDIEEVVKDIVNNKHNAMHLCTLIDEANSKENLLWWIDYFEKANQQTAKTPN